MQGTQSLYTRCMYYLASFPGPSQLSVASSMACGESLGTWLYVLPCFLDWMSTTISLNNSVYNFHLWAATIQGEGWFKKIQVGPLCQIEFRTALGWAHFGLTWSNARGHDAMTLQLRIVVENHSIVDILQWFSTVVIVVSYSATGGFLIPHQAWWLHSTTRVWERWKKVGTLGHMHTELSVYGSLNYMLVENATD